MVSAAKANVLVVEDDPALRSAYRAILKAAGYAVVAVEDGVDALRHIEQSSVPSVVVLDLGLPRLSGGDFRRELAAHAGTQDIPIVVVTGSDVEPGDADNFDCVLRKPISADALISAVVDCLRKRRVST